MTTDSRSGYLGIFMPLLMLAVILTVVFAFGVVVGMGLCWLLA